MFYLNQVTEIFVKIDDFQLQFNQYLQKHQLSTPKKKKNRPFHMSLSEIMTIMVLFHLSNFRSMKHFYLGYIRLHMKKEFPKTVSYNRFVELMQTALFPLAVFIKTNPGECTGISFIDSTPIRVCHNKRIPRNKVFQQIARRGKTTMGWFFGFKLHLVVNDKGELISFVLTPGNVDDREPLIANDLMKHVWGKLFGDKGYISQTLFEILFVDGIQLITHIRNNMKNTLMNINDKILLRKRSLIETINDELKNICQIEHSRHRSVINFFTNILSGLIAYSFLPKKPAIRYEAANESQLVFC